MEALNKPVCDGYYLFTRNDETETYIVAVENIESKHQTEVWVIGSEIDYELEDYDGEWVGPINLNELKELLLK